MVFRVVSLKQNNTISLSSVLSRLSFCCGRLSKSVKVGKDLILCAKWNDFFLKQGPILKTTAAHLYPNVPCWVPLGKKTTPHIEVSVSEVWLHYEKGCERLLWESCFGLWNPLFGGHSSKALHCILYSAFQWPNPKATFIENRCIKSSLCVSFV